MLFELLGYRVDPDRLIGGRQVDLFLEDRQGPLSRCYIVECKDQAAPINTVQYDAFRGRLTAARHEISPKVRGILVASVGFVKEIKAQSLHEDIELVTISELESSVIDFRQYARDLVRQLEGDPALEHFVSPRLVREHLSVPVPAFEALEGWLADPEANQLTLLGDYGTGKTTFLKVLALEMARRYEREVIEGGARGRVPLFVDLREYTQAISLKQIILDLLDTHRIRAASYAAFEYVSREGQILLILDGFDEMASRGNYQVTLRNFRELNRSAVGRAKIILSCRTHYFTDHRDVQRFLGGSQAQSFPVFYTDLYREIAARPNFLLTYLQEFDLDQVEAYLEARCGKKAAAVQEFIRSTYNLEELSRRPVLLEMIVSSANTLGRQTGPVTAGILYQVYTDIWLSRNDWSSSVLDLATKTELLERLAARAISQPGFQLYYAEIPRLIRSWRPGLTDLDEKEIDRELRTASFLVRNANGDYSFSHRSFLEFFYAQHLLAAAARGEMGEWKSGHFRSEIYRFVQDLLASRPAALDRLVVWAADEAADPEVRGHVIKCLSRVREERVARCLLGVLGGPTPHLRLRRFATTALAHQSLPEVTAALIRCARDLDDDLLVRANALLALVRQGSPQGLRFLLELLDEEPAGGALASLQIGMLFRAAHGTSDMALVDACIRYTRRRLEDHSITEQCLELCAARPSAEGEAFCCEILERTERPKMACAAFLALPLARRPEHARRILDLLERHPKHPYSRHLLLALKGTGGSDVEDFLVRCVETDGSAFTEEALEVLAQDFPATLAGSAIRWAGRRRSYTFKLQLAKAYISQLPADGLAFLHTLFHRRERVALRLGILDLLHRCYPQALPEVVRDAWDREYSPGVQRQALEILLRVDRDAAVELMLAKGTRARRTGTRVAVCAILAAVGTEAATAALLESLHDPSCWVRMQALRSLASPGRQVARDRIASTLEGEKDASVLDLHREIFGVLA